MPTMKQMLVSTIVLAQAVAVSAKGAGAINWQTDLDAARATAQHEQKLLLIHFYTDSCGPCRILDATVFNQPNVASVVHSHYVPVKVNANEFQATAEKFGITRVPTDIIVTPQGRVVERLVSPGTPMAYISQMGGIAQQHQRQVGREFRTADSNLGSSQPLNSAYSNLPLPGNSNTHAAQAGQLPVNQTTNPFAADTTNPTSPAQQTSVAPSTPAPKQPAPAVAVTNPYAQLPVTPPPDQRQQAPQPPTGQNATAANTTAAAKPAAADEVQLPPNSPPLGFFGYCPVTMKKENRWQRGDARWGCYHRGRTYLFESAEKRDEFLGNGDEFAPALSGIDPVLAIDSNQIEPGKQEYGIEYDGRFYLFSSEDNLRKFWSQAERYATGVRQAMGAGPEGRSLR